MKVLVHEQHHIGHHYNYLRHLLPRLADLVEEVVVAITPEGQRSEEFQTFLAPLEGRLSFAPILPEADARTPLRERWRLHRTLRHTVKQLKPDYVLAPTGDSYSTVMGLYRLAGVGGLPGRVPAEVGIHFGLGAAARTGGERLRDHVRAWGLLLAGWRRVHFVNLLYHEHVQAQGGTLATRSLLLPDPVAPNPRLSKVDSRLRLGIPEQGRYVGLAAMLDRRKAIGPFVAAFRAAAQPGDRLLLAGQLHPAHLELLQREHSDLIRQERVVLVNRFLSLHEFQAALTALDVVCTPYPGFGHLSGTLLHGVAAGRPILANDFGWSRAMVRRFELGWTCDVLDHPAFVATLRTALAQAEQYREAEPIRRLLAFHAPSNFAESWLTGLRELRHAPPSAELRPWSWVEESLPPERRRLL